MLVLIYAGCKGHKSCGDGSVAVPSEDPDGGVTCVAAPDEEGGVTDGPHSDASHLPDGHVDGPPGGVCGDGICNNNETCSTCPTDCGTCAPFCGDGRCNGTETCSTCPTDCGTCPPDAAPPDASGVCPGFTTIFSGSTSGTTVGGAITNVGRSCGGSTLGPERWYRFTATGTSCHAATSNLNPPPPSPGYDSVVYIRNGCLGTSEVACNDDAAGGGVGPSNVVWTAVAGVDYYIVVDGYNGTSGSYTLTVSCP